MSSIVSPAIPDSIEFADIVVCSTLWCLVVYACGRICWYDSFFHLNTRKIFHLFLLVFSTCRLVSSIMLFFEPTGPVITTYATAEYFLSRNAYIAFGMAFLAVSIFLSSILSISDRVIYRMWVVFWFAFALFESYVVVTTGYISLQPQKYKADGLLYQVALSLTTALSLFAALGMLVVGPSIALRLRRSERAALKTKKNREKSQRKYKKASQIIILITSVTITLMLIRFSTLVYTPVTKQQMPTVLYFLMGLWIPEVCLTCMYLYVMRRARHIPKIDEETPLRGHRHKLYLTDSTEESRSSSEDPHYFLDAGQEGVPGSKYTFFSPSFGGDPRVLPLPPSLPYAPQRELWKGVEEEEYLHSCGQSIRDVNMLSLVSEEVANSIQPQYQPSFVGQAELSIHASFKGKKISPIVALYTEPLAREDLSVLNPKDFHNLRSQMSQDAVAGKGDGGGHTALFQAIMRAEASSNFPQIEAMDLIRAALTEGCTVTSTNDHGYNALHIACTCGSIPILLYLLSCIRDKQTRTLGVCQRTHDNFLPLHFLCGRAFPEGSGGLLLREVLEALCVIEGEGREEMGGKELLNLVNSRTTFGETPLHKACEGMGDPAIVKFLLGQGADLEAVTKLGHTPKDLAKYNHLSEAYALLEQEERKMSRRVAGVPDAMGGSFSETFCLPNKCVDPLIMNSYIARKDRDRTEVIFHQCNEFSFHKTLLVRGVRQSAQLYFGLHNVSVDLDNLDLAELCGIADFSIADLVCSRNSTIAIPLFQPKTKQICGTITVQLEHIDSYKHLPSGITRGYIFPCKHSVSSSSSSSPFSSPPPPPPRSFASFPFTPDFYDNKGGGGKKERKGEGEKRSNRERRLPGPKKLVFEEDNCPIQSPPPPSPSPLPSLSSPALPIFASPHPPSPPSPPSPSGSFEKVFTAGSLELVLISPSSSPSSPVGSASPLPSPISPLLPFSSSSPSPLTLPLLPSPSSSPSPPSPSPSPPSPSPSPSPTPFPSPSPSPPLSPSPSPLPFEQRSPLSHSHSFRDAPSNPCPQTPFCHKPSHPSPHLPSLRPPLCPPFSLSSPDHHSPLLSSPHPLESSPRPAPSPSYSLPSSPPAQLPPSLRIREELQEGEFSFALPALLLTLLQPHRETERDHLNQLAERLEASCSQAYQQFDYEATALFQGHLKDMGAVSVEQDLAFKLRNIAKKHSAHCQRMKDSIRLYSNYHKSYQNLTFKPSTCKGDACLAFIPTNLHHQKMKVYPRGHRSVEKMKLKRLDGKVRKRVESKIDPDVEPEGEYHVTTFGAPAAHPLKFKGGGLWHLQTQFDEKLKAMAEGKRTKPKHHPHHRQSHPKPQQHLQQLQQLLQFQEQQLVSEETGSEGDSSEREEKSERTKGKEREKKERGRKGEEKEREKEKMRKVRRKVQAISALELHYQLVRRKDICFSQILPAVATCVHEIIILNRSKPKILTQYIQIGLLLHFESLLSTYQAELGMLADYEIAIKNFVSKLMFRFVLDRSEGKNEELGLEWVKGNEKEGIFSKLFRGGGQDDEFLSDFRFFSSRGEHESLLITLPIPPKFYKPMQPVLEGKTISVIPTFFTQGINEQQTFANRLGGTAMQERINRDSVNILALYFQKFQGSFGEGDKGGLGELFAELMRIVKMSRREKNVRILSLSADIARLMNGGRLTSCKSAKDRTSMAVTWEQARLLSTNHHLSPDAVDDVLTVMRSAGVRRENAYKNIGKNKFAFNVLQLKMIPGIYRAPKGSGGAEVT